MALLSDGVCSLLRISLVMPSRYLALSQRKLAALPLVRLTGVGRNIMRGSSLPFSFAAPSISTDAICPSAVRHKPHCTLTADQPGRFNVPCAASES